MQLKDKRRNEDSIQQQNWFKFKDCSLLMKKIYSILKNSILIF